MSNKTEPDEYQCLNHGNENYLPFLNSYLNNF